MAVSFIFITVCVLQCTLGIEFICSFILLEMDFGELFVEVSPYVSIYIYSFRGFSYILW